MQVLLFFSYLFTNQIIGIELKFNVHFIFIWNQKLHSLPKSPRAGAEAARLPAGCKTTDGARWTKIRLQHRSSVAHQARLGRNTPVGILLTHLSIPAMLALLWPNYGISVLDNIELDAAPFCTKLEKSTQ
jgi:hypothetical protein